MSIDTPAPRRSLAGPARVVRRVLAPAGLELEGQLATLQQEFAELRAADAELRAELAHERERTQELTDRVARLEELVHGPAGSPEQGLAAEVARVRDGLHEERRLHLRVAELTDLVTELVLPLHDRDIDPAALSSLRPDTL
ncbi:DUF6752 domain-containing protein [Geodermatophilus sp. SYSU D00698]